MKKIHANQGRRRVMCIMRADGTYGAMERVKKRIYVRLCIKTSAVYREKCRAIRVKPMDRFSKTAVPCIALRVYPSVMSDLAFID